MEFLLSVREVGRGDVVRHPDTDAYVLVSDVLLERDEAEVYFDGHRERFVVDIDAEVSYVVRR